MQVQASAPSTVISSNANRFLSLRSYVLGLLALAMLLIAINSLMKTLSMPWIGILMESTGQVFEVQQGSSNIGRIQVNDQVVFLNGLPLNEARPVYGDARVGESIPIVVKRGQEMLAMDLLVEAPSQEIFLRRAIHQFTGFVFWLLGVAVFIRNSRQTRSQVFLLMCLCVTGILSHLDLLRYQVPGTSREIYNTSLWLFGATFVHIHILFPIPRTTYRWRAVTSGLYLVALYVIISYVINGAGKVPTLTVAIANSYLVVSLLLSILLLVNAWRIGDGLVHRQLRTLVFGTLVAAAPIILFIAISSQFTSLSSDIALVGLVAFPATYAFVLRTEDLITTDHLLYQVLLYVLLSLSLVVGYLIILQVLGYLNPLVHTSPLTGSLISLVLAFTFSPTREVIDRALNRVFYGVGYNYLQVLNPAVRKIANLQLTSVIEVLTQDIPAVLGVANTGVWLATNGGFERIGGNLLDRDLDTSFATSQWQQHFEKQSDEPLLLKQEPLLSDQFPNGRNQNLVSVRWMVPLNLSNELQGIWLLGPRVKDESFSPIDQRLVALTAQTVALVLKVSNLLHELQVQLDINSADHAEMLNAYRQLTRVRDDERQYLARELHDEVLQSLITLGMAFERLTVSQPDTHNLVGQVQVQLKDMVVSVRSICQGLRPPALATSGLHSGIKSLASEMSDKYDLKVSLELNLPRDLPSEWQLNLYRIVQESLMNVAKHANTSVASVQISTTQDELTLTVKDQGVGFNPSSVIGHRFGLVGLRERARALGGDLTVTSVPGQGTTINANIALSKLEHSGS